MTRVVYGKKVIQLFDCQRISQVGAIDALLAQLCIRHKPALLTTDNDFVRATSHCPLRVWGQDR